MVFLYIGKFYLVNASVMLKLGFITSFRNVRYHLNEYTRQQPVNAEELFNLRHSSLRNAIERAFGILKKQFPILVNEKHYLFKTQVRLVSICCILRNYMGCDPKQFPTLVIVCELDQATRDGAKTAKETNRKVATNININVGSNSSTKDTESENADVIAESTQEIGYVHSMEKLQKKKGHRDSLSKTVAEVVSQLGVLDQALKEINPSIDRAQLFHVVKEVTGNDSDLLVRRYDYVSENNTRARNLIGLEPRMHKEWLMMKLSSHSTSSSTAL